MQSAKQSAEAMIRTLPEDATFEDIQYRLYVLAAIEDGLESIDRGEVIPHDEVRRRMAKWLID